MAWLSLIIAGIAEMIGVTGINMINQSRKFRAFAVLIGGFTLSFIFLSIAMETIAMSTAYAVWTGIGTVGSAIIGMFLYGESKDWRRLVFISMVLSAAVGLKLIG